MKLFEDKAFTSGIYRTDLGKCTRQYDETQGNKNTQALSTKTVFFGCKKKTARQQKKKEAKKKIDKKK